MGRFCLLKNDGLYLTEGISYADHTSAQCDPAITVIKKKNKINAIWTNPEKKSWREITALLSFVSNNNEYDCTCYQLKLCDEKVRTYRSPVGLWTLGIKVSSNSGEFKVSGRDDFVESSIEFENITEILNENWFTRYSRELSALEKTAFNLSKSVEGYYSGKREEKKDIAKKCSFRFWDNCESLANELLEACIDCSDENGIERLRIIRKKFAQLAQQCYDEFCPCLTSKQFLNWAANRIHTAKYERMED